MACGLPVLTSNRGALAEVAGDDALLVDPLDVGAIGRGARHVWPRTRNSGTTCAVPGLCGRGAGTGRAQLT